MLLDTARRLDRQRAARQAAYTGSDVRGHATFTLTLDGTPINLELDDDWLASVSTERLVETLREALSNAYVAADAARQEADPTTFTGSQPSANALVTNKLWPEEEDF